MVGCRDFFLSCPLYFFSILTPLLLPSSCVSLSYFILAVPIRECLGKHLFMSFPFPIAVLNGTSFFSLFGARETKHSQRTLLLALFLKWLFKWFYLIQNFILAVPVCMYKTCRAQSNVAKCDWGPCCQITTKVHGDVKLEASPRRLG